MVGPMASPSRPSVRFTALLVPTMTTKANGRYSHQGKTGLKVRTLMKGIESRVSSSRRGCEKPLFQSMKKRAITATKMKVCQKSFLRPARPLELRLLSFSQSSANPISPNPTVMIIAAQTSRLVRSAKRSVPNSIAQRMSPPPMAASDRDRLRGTRGEVDVIGRDARLHRPLADRPRPVAEADEQRQSRARREAAHVAVQIQLGGAQLEHVAQHRDGPSLAAHQVR